MKSANVLVALTVLSLTAACAGSAGPSGPTPGYASNTVIRGDKLQKMPGASAFDALQTLPVYIRTMRQQAPRVVLIVDGVRNGSVEILKGIQARDVFEIRMTDEAQTPAIPGEVEVIVTTLAGRARSG
jgi:hypothetical protein